MPDQGGGIMGSHVLVFLIHNLAHPEQTHKKIVTVLWHLLARSISHFKNTRLGGRPRDDLSFVTLSFALLFTCFLAKVHQENERDARCREVLAQLVPAETRNSKKKWTKRFTGKKNGSSPQKSQLWIMSWKKTYHAFARANAVHPFFPHSISAVCFVTR